MDLKSGVEKCNGLQFPVVSSPIPSTQKTCPSFILKIEGKGCKYVSVHAVKACGIRQV
jgi:hypothetical protein